MSIASFEIFLKLDAIEGESTVTGHEKETVVLSWEHSLKRSSIGGPSRVGGGRALGEGGSSGRTNVLPIRFRKPIDKGSIPLLLACVGGTTITDALFTFSFLASGLEFYKVKLADVLVTDIVQVAGADEQYPLTFDALAAGSDNHGFLEVVTLAYTRIQWEYRGLTPTGQAAAVVRGSWNVLTA